MTQPTHADIERTLGRLEGNAAALEQRMDRLEKVVTEGFEKLSNKIDALEKMESERKGAWKVVAAVSSLIGAIAAAVFSALLEGLIH